MKCRFGFFNKGKRKFLSFLSGGINRHVEVYDDNLLVFDNVWRVVLIHYVR